MTSPSCLACCARNSQARVVSRLQKGDVGVQLFGRLVCTSVGAPSCATSTEKRGCLLWHGEVLVRTERRIPLRESFLDIPVLQMQEHIIGMNTGVVQGRECQRVCQVA